MSGGGSGGMLLFGPLCCVGRGCGTFLGITRCNGGKAGGLPATLFCNAPMAVTFLAIARNAGGGGGGAISGGGAAPGGGVGGIKGGPPETLDPGLEPRSSRAIELGRIPPPGPAGRALPVNGEGGGAPLGGGVIALLGRPPWLACDTGRLSCRAFA